MQVDTNNLLIMVSVRVTYKAGVVGTFSDSWQIRVRLPVPITKADNLGSDIGRIKKTEYNSVGSSSLQKSKTKQVWSLADAWGTEMQGN